MLEILGLLHDNFADTTLKKKSEIIMVLYLHWSRAKAPRRPLMTVNRWEALIVYIKRTEGEAKSKTTKTKTDS